MDPGDSRGRLGQNGWERRLEWTKVRNDVEAKSLWARDVKKDWSKCGKKPCSEIPAAISCGRVIVDAANITIPTVWIPWNGNLPAIQKDPSFTSKTTLMRRKINVCLQFPSQSSLLRSHVGSLGPLSVWRGRRSTLQVYALCRAKARLEQSHQPVCAAFQHLSVIFCKR